MIQKSQYHQFSHPFFARTLFCRRENKNYSWLSESRISSIYGAKPVFS